MKTRFAATSGLALACCALLAAFAVGSSGKSYKSTVTIKSGTGRDFNGVVKSDRAACEQGRHVTLEMVTSSGNEKVGHATTNPSGKWDMPGSYVAGKYFAKVKAKTLSGKGVQAPVICLADVSPKNRF